MPCVGVVGPTIMISAPQLYRSWQSLTAFLLLSGAFLSPLMLTACTPEVKVATTPSLAETVYEVSTIHPEFKNRERSFTLSGRVVAAMRSDVRPQVDGIIIKRLFEEGSEVSEGTPLYAINPSPFKASYDHAKASYERAIVQRKMALKDYERFKELYKHRSASEKERDDAQLTYELALADEKLSKAALETAQISLDYTTVRAPISGIIGTSRVTRGALVNANQSEPLATIIDLNKVYVDMEQSASDWRLLRSGLLDGSIYLDAHAYDVSLYFNDGSLYSRLGVLSLSEVLVDEDSGAISVRASFDNPDHLLLLGMAVVCRISGGTRQNVMALPAHAVRRDPKGKAYVFVVQGDRVTQTEVRLGELYNDGWQILDGLDSSYEVVIAGNAVLHHGSKVNVIKRDGIDLRASNVVNSNEQATMLSAEEPKAPVTPVTPVTPDATNAPDTIDSVKATTAAFAAPAPAVPMAPAAGDKDEKEDNERETETNTVLAALEDQNLNHQPVHKIGTLTTKPKG